LKGNNVTSLTIERAGESRGLYLSLLEKGKGEAIDLGSLAEIDLAGIQILVALIRDAASRKRDIRLTGALRAEVTYRVALSGLCGPECATGEQLESAIRALL
jgi:anti-anti-sigma regulatory factor